MRRLLLICCCISGLLLGGCLRAESEPGASRIRSPSISDRTPPTELHREPASYRQNMP